MKTLLKAFIVISPWFLKRRLLRLFFGYELHTKAHIGLAWIFPAALKMEQGATIAHFSVAIHLDSIILERNASIGRNNWITGFSSKTDSRHFVHQLGRISRLYLHEGAAITKHHHLDCTSPIEIGKFSIVAGYHSQFLTHAIDIKENRQDSQGIKIGQYCFVGTNVVILGGAELPEFSVLGAKSLLNTKFLQSYQLYAGVPAKRIKEISADAKYFSRGQAFVY